MLVLMRAFGDGKRGFEAEIVSGNCLSKLYFDELLIFKISVEIFQRCNIYLAKSFAQFF